MDGFDETYTRSRRKPAAKKQEKKSDWLVRLSAVQLVLAVLGVVLLFGVSKASPGTFEVLRGQFKEIMSVDMSVKEVVASFRKPAKGEALTQENSTETAAREQATIEETSGEAVTEELSTAAGGEDLEVFEATDVVCFAPFSSTVPICVPVNGEISSRFGYRSHPITGEFGVHNGTDIAAPEGTPIAAAFNGVVEETGFNSVRGNYILLSHGGDTQTLYMHCSELYAPEGAVIRQGEIIASVGSTGWSTGPHLHFSIIINGKYCNPEWLF